jgi:metallophosphoesterase superfamily enzyme
LQVIEAWRQRHADLEILLVRGNHDLHAGDPPHEWRIHCVDGPLDEEPFVYRHEPIPAAEGYVLAGHLHPAALLNGRGRQSLTLPCFHFAPDVGTLPAFGDFTGSAVIRPAQADRVFVIAADEVIAVGRDDGTPP